MMDWNSLVLLASTGAGVVSSVWALWSALRAQKRRTNDLGRLTEEAEGVALESSQIRALGRYLFDDVGAVRVSDVAANAQVRVRTERALARVSAFLAGEGTFETEPRNPNQSAAAGDPSLELDRARDLVARGETWDGLARMRRYVELTLKEAEPELANARMGAGQLVRAVSRYWQLPVDATRDLLDAISLANRAIHGEQVETDEALGAIDSAQVGLEKIGAARRNQSTLP